MKKNKVSKQERTEIKKKILEDSLSGSGIFIFKNKGNATLQLPKPSLDGKRWVDAGQTWRGDSFFLKMIPKEAALVKTLISPDKQNEKKEIKMENKLLLDQPDQVTPEGKVEHVVVSDVVEINENTTKKKKRTKSESQKQDKSLITEDPVAGVTIIRD
jgi:hypothetical protein